MRYPVATLTGLSALGVVGAVIAWIMGAGWLGLAIYLATTAVIGAILFGLMRRAAARQDASRNPDGDISDRIKR